MANYEAEILNRVSTKEAPTIATDADVRLVLSAREAVFGDAAELERQYRKWEPQTSILDARIRTRLLERGGQNPQKSPNIRRPSPEHIIESLERLIAVHDLKDFIATASELSEISGRIISRGPISTETRQKWYEKVKVRGKWGIHHKEWRIKPELTRIKEVEEMTNLDAFKASSRAVIQALDIESMIRGSDSILILAGLGNTRRIGNNGIDETVVNAVTQLREIYNNSTLSPIEKSVFRNEVYKMVSDKIVEIAANNKDLRVGNGKMPLSLVADVLDSGRKAKDSALAVIELDVKYARLKASEPTTPHVPEEKLEETEPAPVSSEPEVPTYTENQIDIANHVQDLSHFYDEILTQWKPSFNSLSQRGFDPLTKAFTNGAEGEDWELEGLGNRHAARDKTQVLAACYDVLKKTEPEEARKVLLHSLNLESAVTSDIRRIRSALPTELKQNVKPLPEDSHLESNITWIRENMDSVFNVLRVSHEDIGKEDIIERLRIMLEPEDIDSPVDEVDMSGFVPPDPELEGIAEQLDWEVLPPTVRENFSELREIIAKGIPKGSQQLVEWYRLENLVQLREEYDGQIYRSKPNTLSKRKRPIPYFVLTFRRGDVEYAVAECPMKKNATYIVREDLTLGRVEEILSLGKPEAIELGAQPVVHAKPEEHLERIKNRLTDLSMLGNT